MMNIKLLFSKLFNLNMGYKVIQLPYIYENTRYIGYILIKPYRLFGLYGYDTITHFVDKEDLNKFLGTDLKLDAENNIIGLCDL